MTEDTKIIEQLRNLKKIPVMPNEERFLRELRLKLSNRIQAHSAINASPEQIAGYHKKFFTKCFGTANTFFAMIHPRSKAAAGSNLVISKNPIIPWYLKFSLANSIVIPHTIIMPQKTVAIIFIVCLFGLSGIALASQHSLPGDTFYPIKILSEEVQSSFAYTPESKAIIYTSFTAKRVAEVKAILDQQNISPEMLDIALTNLQKNTSDTAVIIDEEGQKGTNVEELAKNINNTFNKNTDDLNQIFDHKNSDLIEEEGALENKIEKAKKTDNHATVSSLNTKLDETKNKRKSLKSAWDKSKETLHENTHKIENRLKQEGPQKKDKSEKKEELDDNKEEYSEEKKNNEDK